MITRKLRLLGVVAAVLTSALAIGLLPRSQPAAAQSSAACSLSGGSLMLGVGQSCTYSFTASQGAGVYGVSGPDDIGLGCLPGTQVMGSLFFSPSPTGCFATELLGGCSPRIFCRVR